MMVAALHVTTIQPLDMAFESLSKHAINLLSGFLCLLAVIPTATSFMRAVH
jgi:hypothetical protein